MLFNNQDWKLSVTDINPYENTVSLDGQSYPLSLAIKTLIPGYLSGLPPTSRESMELLEALAEAGVADDKLDDDLPEAKVLYQALPKVALMKRACLTCPISSLIGTSDR